MQNVVSNFALVLVFVPVALALLAGFAVFLTAFRLAARARHTTPQGRTGWMLLAGVAAGSGLWSTHSLILALVSGSSAFHGNLTVAGLFLAIGAAFAAFTIPGRSSGIAASGVAGVMTAAGLSGVAMIGQAATVGLRVNLTIGLVALVGVGLTVAAAVAHRIAAASDAERSAERAAAVMAPAVTLASLVLVLATHVPVTVPHPVSQLGSGALAASVAIVLFLVVATGMATALIHRDAEFASQARLKRLADASVEGLAIVHRNRIVEVNEALVRLAGRSRENLIGHPFVGSLLLADGTELAERHERLNEARLVGEGNRSVPVEVVSRPIDYDGRTHVVYAIRDLSDRRDAELRIRFLAEHDVLTGLPNRAAFQRELNRACQAFKEGGEPFSLFCLDLDRFKEANDVFGHHAGDDVLRQVADRLTGLLPAGSFAARLGGDEFVVILPATSTPHAVGSMAETLVTALSRPYLHDGQRIAIGASVGVAMAPADGREAEPLLARADMALYRAKNQGRGRFCFFEVAMDEETRFRRALAFDLRDAVEGNQLEVAYQPLADMASNGITGFEALVRWNHPVHGPIEPTVLIAIAEESGIITRLGEWVLRTAAAEAAQWRRPLRIAVNLSPLQLEQQTLPDIVEEVLIRTGLPADRLELEVTESALMRNPERALDVLRRIKALGVRIAMDDFGTGYSSLSTLQSFPFDKLKIDRSFVDRVGTSPQAASIVRAVVGLSRSLDIRVVAEGVETETQFSFLSGESCDEVQGFMIGMPLPIGEYAHLTSGAAATPSEAAAAALATVGRFRRIA